MVPPMRRTPDRTSLDRARRAVLRGAVALAGVWATVAGAEPAGDAPTSPSIAAPAGDRIAQFLGEHGLVPTTVTEPSLVRQVRERAADWTSDLVISAMNFLGVRYRRGGESAEDGFDCSGFTRHVFEASIGLVLPRRANEQAKAQSLQPVNREQLRPGDLVFFNTLRSAFSHVGIYVGDGKFIHAPRSGAEVRVEDMRIAYWSKRFNGARRALSLETGSTADAKPAGVAAAAKGTAGTKPGAVAAPASTPGISTAGEPAATAATAAAPPGPVY